jgi:hypothetical protein
MLDKATVIRFVEAFIAVFVVSLAADPIFAGGSLDLFGANGLQSLAAAAVAAAVLAIRRAMAVSG